MPVLRETSTRDPDEPLAETPEERSSRLVRTVELLARQLDSRDATISRYQDLETALYARIGKLALDLEDMERSVALAMEQKGAAEARVRELMAERIAASRRSAVMSAIAGGIAASMMPLDPTEPGPTVAEIAAAIEADRAAEKSR